MIISKNFIFIILKFLFCIFLIVINWNILPKFKNVKKTKHNSVKFINKSKFVSFECHMDFCGGLADRFKGIMNAYAWSIFTNRNFIINISQPCNIENLIIPNEVDWLVNLKALGKNKFLNNYYNKKLFELKKTNNFKFRDDLINIDITNYQSESDIIKIYTNLEWFSSYSKNRYE